MDITRENIEDWCRSYNLLLDVIDQLLRSACAKFSLNYERCKTEYEVSGQHISIRPQHLTTIGGIEAYPRDSAIKHGVDSNKFGTLMRLLKYGIRMVEDFEVALKTHKSGRRAANRVAKYQRAYDAIYKMQGRALVDESVISTCLQIMQTAIRRDAPAELAEIAVLKVVSGGKLLDVKKAFSRIRSAYLNRFSQPPARIPNIFFRDLSANLNRLLQRPSPKPLSWLAFVELDSLPNNIRPEEIDNIINGDDSEFVLSTRKVSWKILPPGKHPFPELVKHFETLQNKNEALRYDRERLSKVCELETTDTYTGLDDFSGYIVFDYSKYNFAILECPIVSNAIYILLGDWQNLCRLSKGELLNFHAKDTIRITHAGGWFDRLKEVFDKLKQAEKGCDFI